MSHAVLGIRREDKNKWERRVPLTPDHVRSLIEQLGVRVLVQPSYLRVFSDDAYADAGAELTEDLSEALVIVAVKEVPMSLLLQNKTYMFFSHTIKAQPRNMPLLDSLLAKRIRLIDYECITAGGLRGGKRLVAFGRLAGIAGIVDFLRGMGERFLSLGYSTPFLNVAAMYMYPDVEHAKAAIKDCGEMIRKYGLPAAFCPFTVVVTGHGNVAKGVLEVLDHLPIRIVDPFDLEQLVAATTGTDRTHVIYVAVAKDRHMVRKRSPDEPTPALHSAGSAGDLQSLDTLLGTSTHPSSTSVRELIAGAATSDFDSSHYRMHPELYAPLFHVSVLPYTSIIINSMYWDSRYPRLVSCRQARELHNDGRLRLLGVCDISCDLKGSIEFLSEYTSIDDPFYIYNVTTGSVQHDLEAPGVLYHAVDHLPSECPKDASQHFGACLVPLLPSILESASVNGATAVVPAEVAGAVVCADGALTANFHYIAALRASADRAEHARSHRRSLLERSLKVELVGHLFDTGVVSKILDIIEDSGDASAKIVHCSVGKDRFTPTHMLLAIIMPGSSDPTGTKLSAVLDSVYALTRSVGIELIVEPSEDEGAGAATAPPTVRPTVALPSVLAESCIAPPSVPCRRVLVLGAGYVSAPLVEYLLRRPGNSVTVTSVILAEAERLAASHPRCTPLKLDVLSEDEALGALIAAHDIVVSLVPAPCHPVVAKHAIAHHRHMVTASYVSPEMAALHEAAVEAGIVIVNEAGLDPGIDHMSAMEIIDSVKTRGGEITSFNSVCGGLPAPEAANNPLGYKFSWSPRGSLLATRNAASYLLDGSVVQVSGADLLTSVRPFHLNPAFALEVIPNRNALPYADKYCIAGPALKTMSRGTLRYGGFCAAMAALTSLGFLNTKAEPLPYPPTLRGWFAAAVSMTPASTDDDLLAAAVTFVAAAARRSLEVYVDALPPALVQGSRAAAALSSNISLDSNSGCDAAFRRLVQWCGLLADKPIGGLPAQKHETCTGEHVPIDTLVAVLTKMPEMAFAPGERDMVIMQHTIEASFPDGHVERHVASLIEYANAQGQTAMARTVGLTVGIAAQLVLDSSARLGNGPRDERGVIVPLAPAWYKPILEGLRCESIALTEVMTCL